MEPNKNLANVDPDYEKYNLARKEIEQKGEESELTSDRLYNIIAEEFDKELTFRQQQMEEIEDKIFKAQKLLHLVRYVLVSSYYNKRNLEYESSSENPSTSNFDAQSRIHPAVKKLLGNNSLEVLAARGKRKVHNKNNESNEVLDHSQPLHVKKIKLEETVNDNIKCNTAENVQNSLKRKKTKHRILVGNISKWMPSLENDNTTHKWMVYVRGPKEAPDVSHLIEKVVFYLHPSYKPHDVVEVSEYPFHLSRRGWGEFPLRVQLFFKCTLNKPVSIIHNLKLDKTYTGRQTLGNETVVDLYLHDEASVKFESEILPDSKESFKNVNIDSDTFIKNEIFDVQVKDECDIPMGIKEELPSTSEHSYCHDNEIKPEDDGETANSDTFLLDHSYSLPYSDFRDSSQCDNVNQGKANESVAQGNNLIFGLDDSYRDDKQKITTDFSKDKCVVRTFTTATGHPIKVLPQSFNKLLLSNGNIVQIKVLKTPQSFVKNIDTTVVEVLPNTTEEKVDTEKYKVNFPAKLFKNVGEALPYLFKRLPLWNELASDDDYKRTYPYVACSESEFFSWNIGKQLNSEWNRAKDVKKIISSVCLVGWEKWNTKALFMYARSHGYSPKSSEGILFSNPSEELELLMTCFSDSPQRRLFQNVSHDVNVDVVHENASSSTLKDSDVIDITDSSLRHHCTFVKEVALDCSIILKPEEIEVGVAWNGAERMILEAVRCLADNLIRRAKHHAICQKNFSEPTEIGVNDIKVAMNERSEIRSITEYQKRRLVKDFFS